MGNDPDNNIRRLVTFNKLATVDTLQKLSEDSNELVRHEAKAALQRIDARERVGKQWSTP
jgi:hypothetical protein